MRTIATHLLEIVEDCTPRLLAIAPEEAARRHVPGSWSKKEILGHLIDSACNNQQKFVQMLASDGHVDFVGYAQDSWVAVQRYQEAAWSQLVELWRAHNRHLAHVIAHTDPERCGHTITIDGKGPFRLDFVMPDYVEHLKHHLRVVLPEAGLTTGFRNVYGA